MCLRLNGNFLYNYGTQELAPNQSPDFLTLSSLRIDSKEPIPSGCNSLVGRYDNPIPTWFLAPIDCLKIPAQLSFQTVWVLFCLIDGYG